MKLAIVPIEIEGQDITQDEAEKLAGILTVGIKMAAAQSEVRVGEVIVTEVAAE